MKICIVSNYKKNGYGESTRPYYIGLNLSKQGHKILHICQHSGCEDGVEYVKGNTTEWQPSIIKRIIQFVALSLKIRIFNPDFIYMHQFNCARWALKTRIMPKRKFVFDAHTSAYFEAYTLGQENKSVIARVKAEEAEICLKSDYIICASAETRDLLKEAYNLNDAKLFVVGNATNLTPVTEAELGAPKTSTQGSFICFSTIPFDGFWSNNLALFYLFEIAGLVYALAPQIKFVVAGGGEKPVPPTPNIVYAGYVPDLRKEILDADICLMPYPDNAVCGGARNKFCDFIALGKIVISSPEGMRGMFMLDRGKNCVVADSKAEFAAKTIELFEGPDKVKALEAEVLKVKNRFSWSERAAEVAGIFKKIIN